MRRRCASTEAGLPDGPAEQATSRRAAENHRPAMVSVGGVVMVLATRSAAISRNGTFRFCDTVRSISGGQRCMPMMMPLAWSITDRDDNSVRR